MRSCLWRSLGIAAVVCVLSVVATSAPATCAANNFNRTFADIMNGINGTFIEAGAFDCISVTITDRTITSELTMEVYDTSTLSDRLVLSNQGAGGALNICFVSYLDSNNQNDTCDPVGKLTQSFPPGDPALETLNSGVIHDIPTGVNWFANLVSQDSGNNSDTLQIAATPEPGSMLLLAAGLLGLGLTRRRRA